MQLSPYARDEAVLPQIRDSDIELETYRSSGAGGQHVNKTNSAVRLRHSSGIIVTCQEERSQHANRAKAKEKLRLKLLEQKTACAEQARQSVWDAEIAIEFGRHRRTYALSQSRIVDKLSGVERFDVDAVLKGAITPFLQGNLRGRAALVKDD